MARAARCICEGAVQRVDDARKIRQQAVARGADDPSALCRYQRVDCAAKTTKSLMRARFILAHQAAESDHIGVQNGGKFPLPRGTFLRRSRRDMQAGAASGCV